MLLQIRSFSTNQILEQTAQNQPAARRDDHQPHRAEFANHEQKPRHREGEQSQNRHPAERREIAADFFEHRVALAMELSHPPDRSGIEAFGFALFDFVEKYDEFPDT